MEKKPISTRNQFLADLTKPNMTEISKTRLCVNQVCKAPIEGRIRNWKIETTNTHILYFMRKFVPNYYSTSIWFIRKLTLSTVISQIDWNGCISCKIWSVEDFNLILNAILSNELIFLSFLLVNISITFQEWFKCKIKMILKVE